MEAWLEAQRARYEPTRVDDPALRDALDTVLGLYRLSADAAATSVDPVANEPRPDVDSGPRTICVCGHTRAEHVTVGGPFGRGRLLCDACDGDSMLACKEFDAL